MLTSISADFESVRQAYNEYMFHEAAERGYDAQASRAANDIFLQRAEDFKHKHGVSWTEYEAERGTIEEGKKVMQKQATVHTATPEELRAGRVELDKPAGGTVVVKAPFVASVGHNKPPLSTDEGEFRRRVHEENTALIDTAEKLLTGKPQECKDDTYAEKLTNFIKRLSTCAADLEKLRKKETEPFLKGQRMVNGYFGEISEKLDKMKRAANKPLTEYLNAKAAQEKKDREAAAEKLRKEADAQRAADAALYDAGRPMEAGEARRAADKIDRHADALEASASQTGAALVQMRTGSASSSLRKRTVAEIVDRQTLDLEALRPYFTADALQRALNAYVTATKATELKGAKIYETTEASVR